MMAKMKKSKKGFTLVELIVVIAIIAIIAAVAVPTTISYVNKAKLTTAASEAADLANSVNTHIQSEAAMGSVDLSTAAKAAEILQVVLPEPKVMAEDGATVTFVITPADRKLVVTVNTNLGVADEAEAESAGGSLVADNKLGATKTIVLPAGITIPGAESTFVLEFNGTQWAPQA